ncbi:MAG: hypothetical protein FWH00_02140, partial [Oscillospiraceae bacterium]|nr:hypothetical protein [Oscillospiraceae bacterium]
MKRILPFILAITMMLGAFTPGLAWSGPIMEVWESIGSDATGTFYPGQTITFDLYPSMFDWDTGWEDRPRNVTRQHLRDSDITIRTVGLDRSVMSTAIGERNGRAYVTVRFEENFGNLAGTRINTSIYLAIGGERQDRSRVDVRGTLSSGPPLTTSQSSAQPGGLVLPPPGSQFGAAVVPPVEQRPAVTEESARTRTAEAVQS